VRILLQHYLNPVNLWSRLGGRFTPLFKLYEGYLWQPLLRGRLNGKGIDETQLTYELSAMEKVASQSNEDRTKSGNPSNVVPERPEETENTIYPDWTPFQYFT
jgi:hypothetical protein